MTVNREDVVGVGTQFCHSEHYKKISFTGSTNVGKWLYRESADTVKRVRLLILLFNCDLLYKNSNSILALLLLTLGFFGKLKYDLAPFRFHVINYITHTCT